MCRHFDGSLQTRAPREARVNKVGKGEKEPRALFSSHRSFMWTVGGPRTEVFTLVVLSFCFQVCKVLEGRKRRFRRFLLESTHAPSIQP